MILMGNNPVIVLNNLLNCIYLMSVDAAFFIFFYSTLANVAVDEMISFWSFCECLSLLPYAQANLIRILDNLNEIIWNFVD